MDEEELSHEEISAFARQFETDISSKQLNYYTDTVLEELIEFYMENGQHRLALEAAYAGIKLHPYDTLFYGRCAQLLNQVDRFLAALTKVNESLAINPSNAEHLILKAQILEKLGRLEEAIETYNEAEALGSDPDEIRLYKARNYADLDENEAGIDLVREIFSKKIESEHLFYETLLYLEETLQWDKGITILTGYLDIDPYSAMGWCSLGHLYNEKNEFEQAIWAYDFAIAIDENFSDAHLQKGYCYSELADHEHAAEAFKRYMELEVPDPLSYTSIGDCFRAMQQIDQAEWHYQKALELDPDFSEAWFGMGIVEAMRSDFKSAIRCFDRTLELCPEDDLYRIHMVHSFMHLKYWAQAEVLLKKILKGRMHYQNAHMWLANTQFQQNKAGEAMKTLRNWLKKQPEDDQVMYQLAAYQYLGGFSEDAQETLSTALKLNLQNVSMFFEFAPELKEDTEIARLIESYSQEL